LICPESFSGQTTENAPARPDPVFGTGQSDSIVKEHRLARHSASAAAGHARIRARRQGALLSTTRQLTGTVPHSGTPVKQYLHNYLLGLTSNFPLRIACGARPLPAGKDLANDRESKAR
jgi:hypothetical protein